MPVPPSDAGGQRRGAASNSVSGPGQNRAASRAARGGKRANPRRDLLDVRRDQRQRPFGAASFDREHPRDRLGTKRIDGESVQRVGRHRDDAAAPDRVDGCVQDPLIDRRFVYDNAPHTDHYALR